MGRIIESIKKEILSWPNVTAEPHRFGGVEFRLDKKELGHIHGERLADLPFPMKTRNELVNSGRVSPHHILPQSGWISYWINSNNINNNSKEEEELEQVSAVLDLFRIRYEQLKSRPQPKKQQESISH